MPDRDAATARSAAGSARAGPSLFGRRFRLGSVLGFEIAVDASWFFVAWLVTWSLASGFFPATYPDLDRSTYWVMGLIGALGLFASVVVHELAHSLVARRHGMRMEGITLFLFGGVAHLGGEPPSPRAEFQIAAIGPVTSIAIGLAFGGLALLAGDAPVPVRGTLLYLGGINLVLAVFNLLPAFPLDGGRVLRSILWGRQKNLRRATRTAARIGAGFGVGLIVLGVLAFLTGNLLGGIWWGLIGLFLRGAARASYEQLVVRETLQGEPVRRFMTSDPTTVPPEATLDDLVERYFYRDYHKLYPVTTNGHLLGCVAMNRLGQIPRDEWNRHTVREIAEPCTGDNSIASEADAVDALGAMQRSGRSRLLVRDGDRLAGVITMHDLLRFLSARVELEEATSRT